MRVWYNLEGDTPVPVSSNEVDWDNRWQLVTKVGAVSTVSTVFLALDHSFAGDGAPVLFETLVFDGPLCEQGERYRTKAEATEGHWRWVQRVEDAADAS